MSRRRPYLYLFLILLTVLALLVWSNWPKMTEGERVIVATILMVMVCLQTYITDRTQ